MEKSLEQINLTDLELVSLSLDNQNNFSFIIERYSKKLSRYMRRITSISEQDNQDLLQNVFIKIYLNLNDFDNSLSFNAWVYRITHNEVIDFARKQIRNKNNGYIDTDDEMLFSLNGDMSILDDIHTKETGIQIQKTFNKMNPKRKEILYLRFIEQYSYRDISDILQKTESNVTSMIHRAKKEFKKYHEQEYE